MHHKTFLNELKAAWQIALFKHKAMHNVAGDKNKNKFAYMIIIGAAILGAVGQQIFIPFFKPSIGMSLGSIIIQVVSVVIGIYVMSYVAKMIFKGHAKHDEFFRVAAYAMILGWASVFPPLGIIVGIWGLVLIFVILKIVHKLTTGGSIGTIIVSILVMAVISMILSPIYIALGLGSNFNFKGMDGSGYMNMGKKGFEFNMMGTEDGGSVMMEDGKMKITGEDGESIEFSIPNFKE